MKGEQRKGKGVCFLGEGKGRKFRRGKRKGSTCDYRRRTVGGVLNGGEGEEDGDCVCDCDSDGDVKFGQTHVSL